MIIAGIALMAAGALVGAYSELQEAEAQQRAAKYSERVARMQARGAEESAPADAATRRRQLQQVLGAQRARYGASGVIPTEGSPLLVMMASEQEAALDVARIRHGGALSAWGFDVQAQQFRERARQIKRTKYLRATGTLLSGLGGAAGAGAGRGATAAPSAGVGAM